MANYSINSNPSSHSNNAEKYQISWKIFFSDYHVFTSLSLSLSFYKWMRARASEREKNKIKYIDGEEEEEEEKEKRQILCAML